MKRINFFIDEQILERLTSLPGTLSEHIRQAIYDYLLKLQKQNISGSTSNKGGEVYE